MKSSKNQPYPYYFFLAIIIILVLGVFLAIKDYFKPKFRILPIETPKDLKSTTVPILKDEDYLNKLISKEWFWAETTFESSIGVKPYDIFAFKLKFNKDLTFSSTSDCNNIGGNFEVFENKIKFKDIVRSEKYCLKSREEDYISGLDNIAELYFNDKDELILKYQDSTTFMRFK